MSPDILKTLVLDMKTLPDEGRNIYQLSELRYDDYDYGEVNQLLERSLKVYIKTVTCYPERTTKRMYDSYWRQFKHSEKVHVNLLLMEARMQAELLYALRAITRHLT
ncbi:hypothetical protein Celaphus_00008868 [Cervus elaphus hippelaphus]|uniref:SESN3 n=1 Tax=Cervus elaphus hippelaphus TaxID=46360 RepID=A0A212DIW8_CEREH|nr:hypothetical protein Celaphus_00008868 [Cervus elaphus hippelaphus]